MSAAVLRSGDVDADGQVVDRAERDLFERLLAACRCEFAAADYDPREQAIRVFNVVTARRS